MRTWRRVDRRPGGRIPHCGLCRSEIADGQPILEITTGAGWKLYRCVGCSDELFQDIQRQLAAADTKADRVRQSTEEAARKLTGAVQGELLTKGGD